MISEHIKKVAGTPEWYGYDFKIAVNYLRFCLRLEHKEDLINRIDELEKTGLPGQVIVQDIMARL